MDDMLIDYEHKINDLERKLDDIEDEKNIVVQKHDSVLKSLQQFKMKSDVVVKKMEEEKNVVASKLSVLQLEFDGLQEKYAPDTTT